MTSDRQAVTMRAPTMRPLLATNRCLRSARERPSLAAASSRRSLTRTIPDAPPGPGCQPRAPGRPIACTRPIRLRCRRQERIRVPRTAAPMSARLSRTSPGLGGAWRTVGSRPEATPSSVMRRLIEMRVPLPMLKATAHALRGRGPQVGLDDVGDVDEIARLLAVAEDRERFSPQHLEGEDRNDVAVGVEPLVRSVHVEVAQADGLELVEFRVREAQLLAAQLGAAVGRVRLDRMVLANRQASSARRKCRRTTTPPPCGPGEPAPPRAPEACRAR